MKPRETLEFYFQQESSLSHKENLMKLLFAYDIDIGTKLFDPKTFNGLCKVVEEAKPDVIVISGIFPYIPLHHGERLKEFMRALDDNIPKKYGERVWKKIQREREKFQFPFFTKLHPLSKGVRNLKEIAIISSDLFDRLYKAVPGDCEIFYLWSGADWYNVASYKQSIIAQEYNKYINELKRIESELKNEKSRLENQLKDIEGKRQKNNTNNEKTSDIKKMIDQINEELYSIKNELNRSKFADFTKTWRVFPETDKIATDEARKKYEDLLKRAFGKLGRKVKIHPYNALTLHLSEGDVLISYNLNMLFSNTPIKTSLQRNRNLIRHLKARNMISDDLIMVVDGAMHKGGFRVVADNLNPDGCDPVYFVKLPPFNSWSYPFAIEKVYKLVELKSGLYEPYASGIVISQVDKIVEFRYVSKKRLENYGRKRGNEKKVRMIVMGDFHIGSVNDNPNLPTNYELLDKIVDYTRKGPPEIIVLTGDLLEGAHLPQIVYRAERLTPYEKEKILKGKKGRELYKLAQRLVEESAIPNLSNQKEELERRFIDKIVPLIRRGTEVILVSGQHYNKSVNYKQDEAKEIYFMIPKELRHRVHPVGGEDIGVGTVYVRGTEFYIVHGPRVREIYYLDPPYALLEQGIKSRTTAKILVCGDFHVPSFGIGDNKLAVISPSLQQATPYMRKQGNIQQPRGIIELVYSMDKTGDPSTDDVIVRFLLDPFWSHYKI